MCNLKVLASLVGIAYVLFVYFLFSGNEFVANCFSALILPILTLGYFCSVEKRSLFFVLFLVLYSISEILSMFSDLFSNFVDYLLGNSLYIFAYTALVIEIAKNLDFNNIFRHYKFSVLVLFILNAYIAYQLLVIVTPNLIFDFTFFVELIYNIVMLLILSFALLNYVNKDSRKAFYILIGALCIVFAEVLNIAYLYVSHQNLLNLLTVSLCLIGFCFLYEQAKLDYSSKSEDKLLY